MTLKRAYQKYKKEFKSRCFLKSVFTIPKFYSKAFTRKVDPSSLTTSMGVSFSI
jgi:hypothetical protein